MGREGIENSDPELTQIAASDGPLASSQDFGKEESPQVLNGQCLFSLVSARVKSRLAPP